jgi:prepilin-type N-terminal cleavage/methylation domain-containing protein
MTPAKVRENRRRKSRGFTLIELTVAMLAGLIVSMALVQISKEANNTFHEEVRAAAAEMSLRVTLERLRADLQRVAFMSTGNLALDPKIAKLAGSTNPLSNLTGPVPGIQRLAGIQLFYGGSTATTPLSANANNGLNPDAIELAGNFSSADEFVGFMCPPNGAGCGGPTVCLEQDTPAMWRIRASAAANPLQPAQTLQAYFNPSFYNANPVPGATRFMARVTDDSGRYQYLLTCGGAATTFLGPNAASINIDPKSQILTIAQTGGRGGVAGFAAGRVFISPVEIVHWQIQQVTTLPPAPAAAYNLGAASTPAPDPNEYVLTRQYVDAMTNLPDPVTLEVVAEYAVDLKFAFTVDNQIPYNNPPGAFVLGANPMLFLQLDNPANAAWAAAPVIPSPTLTIAGPAPERIRSVRVRAAIRSAFPDRTINIAPVPNTGQPYMYRYFIPGATNGLQWARVRTGVTEASLPNQATFYW